MTHIAVRGFHVVTYEGSESSRILIYFDESYFLTSPVHMQTSMSYDSM